MSKLRTFAIILVVTAAIYSRAQSFTTLVNFDGTNGGQPESPLVQGPGGNFYGTTQSGGLYGPGSVFKMTPGGTLTTIYSFIWIPDGAYPNGLMLASDGNFYGTTAQGGRNNFGTIFKITPSGSLTTLYSFDGTHGSYPFAGLAQGTDGNFYGTTWAGGANGDGTVYKVTPSGSLTTLHSFQQTDGLNPEAVLIQATDGDFYGTTYLGGANSAGTIFKITSNGTFSILHSFSGINEGSNPEAGAIQAPNGILYGTAPYGEGNGIYSITLEGVLTTLHVFQGIDGSKPQASLILGPDGNFYGTTVAGGDYNNCLDIGSYGCGTVFMMTPSGTLTKLHSFSGADGANPQAALLQANGTFYGATYWKGSGGFGTVFSFTVGVPPTAAQFVPLTPCRLLDTRPQNGGGGPIPGGTYQTFNLPQLSQSKSCGDLSQAAAYSLNVTLVPLNGQPVSYLTIWPAGRPQPVVSTMNSFDGRTKANAAIVTAGASGAVSIYVGDSANVVLDIDGYFTTPGQSTLAFYPLAPCRVADTRSTQFPQGLGAPHLSASVPRDFPVLQSSCIPSGAIPVAYSLNFTAVPFPSLGDPLSYLEVWPTGQPPANPVSTLNNPTGRYVANAAIVPAGAGGAITADAANDTDLAIDVNGYFATPGNGGLSLYAITPCRVFDTRNFAFGGQPFSGTLYPPIDVVDGGCGMPPAAQAYVFNATVVPSPNLSYLTLWPDSQGQPVVSTLNAADGWVTSNMAIVPNVDGSVDAYAAGVTQLILDISAYFAP